VLTLILLPLLHPYILSILQDNPLLARVISSLEELKDKRVDLLAQLSAWADKLQQRLGDSSMGAILSQMDGRSAEELMRSGAADFATLMGGMGEAGAFDPTQMFASFAPLLGIDGSPEDLAALVEGLDEAGMGDLLADFMTGWR
jgi:hypothetical protein